MAEPDETQGAEPEPTPPPHAWGTWEELLLACAVHRHGTAAWDSVAGEIQKRSSAAVTSLHCRQKYQDLKVRYGSSGPGTVPWLDELRNIRVQELRRELERCDVSIVSLQLKVKRLKEERERDGGERSDPGRDSVKNEGTGEEAGEPVAGEDDRSVNESNSTGSETKKPANEPGLETGEPMGADSCNGSSDSVEGKPRSEPEKVEPDRGEVKECSDVQSSARKGESDKDQSPAVGFGLVRSQSLVQILEMVRSHQLSSAFERRLISQESDHKNSIRQHLDIETIHTRLEESCYSDCNKKFFRDLLILFNNAVLSFGKSSPEFNAAVELRGLISREINKRSKRSDLSTGEETKSLSTKLEPETSDPLVLKPKISGPIIVCRKRSSIAGKTSALSSGGERKKVQKAELLEDKPLLDWKQPDKSSVCADEIENTKKRTSDRFVSGSKNSKKNGKGRTILNQNKISERPSIQAQVKGSSTKGPIENKSDKVIIDAMGTKKRNVTSGNKIKLKSSTLLESLKDSEISPNNTKIEAENKRLSCGNGRGERKREQKGRQVKEQQSPVKRNNGRAARRGAVASPPPAASGKRNREEGDAEVAASRQPKKRSRR